jgi:hypothetical protein
MMRPDQCLGKVVMIIYLSKYFHLQEIYLK